jgi:hypothetical protein
MGRDEAELTQQRGDLTTMKKLALLSGTSDSSFDRPITYVNFQGQAWTYPLRQMVQHLVVEADAQLASVYRSLFWLVAPSISVLLSPLPMRHWG